MKERQQIVVTTGYNIASQLDLSGMTDEARARLEAACYFLHLDVEINPSGAIQFVGINSTMERLCARCLSP